MEIVCEVQSTRICFLRVIVVGVACLQGTLTPLNTWSCPILDLHMLYLLWSIFYPIPPRHKLAWTLTLEASNSFVAGLIWAM